MANLFTVKHGCWTRYSAPIGSGQAATAYNKGRVLSLDSSGNIVTSTGLKSATGGSIAGLALDPYVLNTSTGPYTTKTVVNPTPTNTMILDAGVVINDELQSGVSFAPNNLLYVSTTGFITTSGNGTGPGPNNIVGCALNTAIAGDPARTLLMFWQVTY